LLACNPIFWSFTGPQWIKNRISYGEHLKTQRKKNQETEINKLFSHKNQGIKKKKIRKNDKKRTREEMENDILDMRASVNYIVRFFNISWPLATFVVKVGFWPEEAAFFYFPYPV